jgi:hypothetical protein
LDKIITIATAGVDLANYTPIDPILPGPAGHNSQVAVLGASADASGANGQVRCVLSDGTTSYAVRVMDLTATTNRASFDGASGDYLYTLSTNLDLMGAGPSAAVSNNPNLRWYIGASALPSGASAVKVYVKYSKVI